MPDKSYVTLVQNICPVCGETFETGELLLDRTLKNSFDKYTVTGLSFCPEHKKMQEEGYQFFIEVKNAPQGEKLSIEEADRTGRYACIKKEAALHIFGMETQEINFLEEGVLEQLEAKING